MQDFRHLKVGRRYRVAQAFRDYDGALHDVGETWWFRGADFLPYDDGYTVTVSSGPSTTRSFRMQNREEEQGRVIRDLTVYISAAPPDPAPALASPPPSPATSGTTPVPLAASKVERRRVRDRWVLAFATVVAPVLVVHSLYVRTHGGMVEVAPRYPPLPWWAETLFGMLMLFGVAREVLRRLSARQAT